MSRFLVLYSSVDGHTAKICARLGELLRDAGHEASLVELDEGTRADFASFDRVVIGASIRYGRHRPCVAAFMRAHRAALESRRCAFFSVNIVARKPGKSTPRTNPYVRKFLRQIEWQPARLAVFAGKLDYPRYGFWDRQVIRFIMLLTRGPIDPRAVIDFTDWRQVESFGRALGEP